MTHIGSFTSVLHAGTYGKKINIEVKIKGTSYKNQWSIWVFPKAGQAIKFGGIIQTTSLNQAITELKKVVRFY